jgi:hypothetical protein
MCIDSTLLRIKGMVNYFQNYRKKQFDETECNEAILQAEDFEAFYFFGYG